MASSRPPPPEVVGTARTPGTTLGQYQLVLRVAVGGMGEIWAARKVGAGGFEKIVALKTILPELSYDPNFERMFLDEAELASKIRHPNVVQVLDVGEEPGLVYQVMEWVSGQSLWAVLRASKGNPIPIDVAARIIYQTCAGIHAAHELKGDDGALLGLVHRDVSPQNVLITPDGQVKVVDFGVAKYAGQAANKTQQGELRGKVPYMAPEHVLGKVLDRRADVFALAVLFYQMVSGKHPFLRDDDLLTLAQISSDTPPESLGKLCPSMPKALVDSVHKAMAKTPEERTASALAFMREITSHVRTASLESSNRQISNFLEGLMGEKFDANTRRVKAAIKRLDEEISSPSLARPPMLSLQEPRSSDASVGPSVVTDDDPVVLPMGSLRRSWLGKHPVALALGGGGLLLGLVLGFGIRPGPAESQAPGTDSTTPTGAVTRDGSTAAPVVSTAPPAPTQAAAPDAGSTGTGGSAEAPGSGGAGGAGGSAAGTATGTGTGTGTQEQPTGTGGKPTSGGTSTGTRPGGTWSPGGKTSGSGEFMPGGL